MGSMKRLIILRGWVLSGVNKAVWVRAWFGKYENLFMEKPKALHIDQCNIFYKLVASFQSFSHQLTVIVTGQEEYCHNKHKHL